MKEAQQIVSEKTSALEAEAYKNNRLQVRFDSNNISSFYFMFMWFLQQFYDFFLWVRIGGHFSISHSPLPCKDFPLSALIKNHLEMPIFSTIHYFEKLTILCCKKETYNVWLF